MRETLQQEKVREALETFLKKHDPHYRSVIKKIGKESIDNWVNSLSKKENDFYNRLSILAKELIKVVKEWEE